MTIEFPATIEQYDEMFYNWFNSTRTVLSGDVAANLNERVNQVELKNAAQDQTIAQAIAQINAATDTGWQNLTVRSGWKIITTLRARVRNGVLFLTGVVARSTGLSTSTGTGVVIADFPQVIKDAISSWGSGDYNFGSATSTQGFNCGLYVSKTYLGMNYRARNPYTSEYLSVRVDGAII